MATSLSKSGSGITVDNYDHQPLITLEGSELKVNGHLILSDVPSNIVATPPTCSAVGSFIGFDAGEAGSRHVVSIGKLKNIRFMSIFRFKVWWTTLWVGDNGRDLEHETQIVVLDKSDSGRPYIVLLPIVEGSFRASLQPGHDDNVELCVESGSTKVIGNSYRSILYMHASDDPFNLKVHPQGIWEGVKGLTDGGCPPGLVLIDDGWQSISHDDPNRDQESRYTTEGCSQMECRMINYEENYKFRDWVSPKKTGYPKEGANKGMGTFVKDLKEEFKSVEYVYAWHALCGYWGGIKPDAMGMPRSKVVAPKLTPGLKWTMDDLAVVKVVTNGVGLVDPDFVEQMYEGLHSHLESVGVDGIKVDVIHLLEMVSEEYGGRVEMAKAYYKALTASVNRHFKGNGVIASMQQCNDFMLLGTEAISLGRVGDDFWCTDPAGDPNGTFWLQGCHMVHCAFNSLWMGNFIQPDWDMFQSTHPCAEFHAASRAISGGPIYISDSVGQHNFPLLKSLALPDGSILRCEHYALPTRDCLFEDPLLDGKTMLKIWNLNKFTGVIGLFNCQGGGWCRETRRNKGFSQSPHSVTSTTKPTDIEWTTQNSGRIETTQIFALYSTKSKHLVLKKPSEPLEISLDPLTFELITVSPVITVKTPTTSQNKSVLFAPIGLVNMLNVGGAIQSVEFDDDAGSVKIGVKGTGEMRAFASEKPRVCRIDGDEVTFGYDEKLMVVFHVPWPISSGASIVEYLF